MNYCQYFCYFPHFNLLNNFRFFQEKLLGKSKSKEGVDKVDEDGFVHLQIDREREFRLKNRQQGYDALTTALSAFYAKLTVVLGIAFPVSDVLSEKAPNKFYQGFYLYLYIGSIAFVTFMYFDHVRSRRMFALNGTDGMIMEFKKKKLFELNQKNFPQ